MDDLKKLHEGQARIEAPVANVPLSLLDPYDAEVLRDPYPHYAALRELGPVVWMERYGVFALPCYAEVKDVLADHNTYCSSAGAGLSNFHTEKPWRPPSLLLEADPPLHNRTRLQMVRVLNPGSVRALRATFETEAERMVRAMLELGECDGVANLAEAFPLKVFGDAVGLRAEGRENLLPYGDMVFNAFGPTNARFRAVFENMAAAPAWIADACRRENLAPGGFGARLYEGVDSGDLSEDEAGLLVRSLLSAGLDTTVFTLGNALVNLARHPAQWDLLRDDPSLARNALEEVLRYDGTFHSFYRTTTRPVRLAGVDMGKSQKVLVMTASANRDVQQWPDPDKFDIARRTTGHMAFGHGIHACVGQQMARMEGEIVLATLARMVASIELTGEPVLHFNNTVRGYKKVPLRIKAK
ncbi:MAG: cytochrome P450 [Beijerinckiaceae bacterium]